MELDKAKRQLESTSLFESGIACTYQALASPQAGRDVLQNPKYERAFRLTIRLHDTPLRAHLRLNLSAHKTLLGPDKQRSLSQLFTPCCITTRGRKIIHQWIDRPDVDHSVIQSRHNVVEALLDEESISASRVAPVFQSFAGAEKEFSWFLSSSAPRAGDIPSLQEWISFGVWLSDIHDAVCNAVVDPSLRIDKQYLCPLCMVLEHGLAWSRSRLATEYQDEFSHGNLNHQLKSTSQRICQCEGDIRAHADQIAQQLLLAQERVRVVYEDDDGDSGGVYLRVTKQHGHRVYRACQNTTSDNQQILLVRSRRSHGVWLTTPTLDSLAATRLALRKHLQQLEEEVVCHLCEQYRTSDTHSGMLQAAALVGELDALAAFASVSRRGGFVRPTLLTHTSDYQTVELTNPRDPWQRLPAPQASHKRPRVMPSGSKCAAHRAFSLCLDRPFLLLHGGVQDESTLMYQLGFSVVLNQIGCFVPCDHAILPIFDAIYVRAGAVDHTLHHQSTFLSEMHEMNKTLRHMTPKSLVLIDELCRGTASDEGLALARAICRYLMEHRVLTCLTTQWVELLLALTESDAVSVPHEPRRMVNETTQAHITRLQAASNARFTDQMHANDFPLELVEMIQEEMQGDTMNVDNQN
ncbi:hypothetical protein Poli38472_005201 [Pythium oligandrum]|uniref:DNA mismatch repair proteins mutS family domain-containing protein n=1 Tax=Pythium oligandrum TaxID=41045 RepID=A0A8K1CGI4_PYTOL|nr:hypothetical protein Poli38472_005201 [Pythium oligandrum]|eukprot:TMW62583.1 hypothetical protein Poli38472_005201 [Pythium oligandrum]